MYEELNHYSDDRNIFYKHSQRQKFIHINNSRGKPKYISIYTWLYRQNKLGQQMGKQTQEFYFLSTSDHKPVPRIISFHLFWSFSLLSILHCLFLLSSISLYPPTHQLIHRILAKPRLNSRH